MRELIITREKTFVANFMKMKVYIEDHLNGEITINGVPCRKLGNIKNGEQVSFGIGEERAKVFVIADKLSKGFYNEFFEIPAGTNDIALKGKNHYNPLAGNPFRFEGTANEEVLKNRKKTFRKSLIVMICSFLIGFIIIDFAVNFIPEKAPVPNVFYEEGLEITLTDSFKKKNYEGYTVCFASSDVLVLATKEEFELFDDTDIVSAEDYAELVIEINELPSEIKKTSTDTVYFEYTAESDKEYSYFATAFRSDDAFWLIQFCTETENYASYVTDFENYASSVSFK